MGKIKNLFSTPKKSVITICCIVAAVVLISTCTVFAAGAVAKSTSIGADNAQNFAFADVGVDPVSVKDAHTEFEFEHGQFIYEVDFTANGSRYKYWIKASDGSIVKKESQMMMESAGNEGAGNGNADNESGANEGAANDSAANDSAANESAVNEGGANDSAGNESTANDSTAAKITADEAQQTALKDAGLTGSEVTLTKQDLSTDDQLLVYTVQFHTDTMLYEYEIDAGTGRIYSKVREEMPTPPASADSSAANEEQTSQSGSQGSVTNDTAAMDEAKATALSDAGLSASDVTFGRVQKDYDDGIQVYEIEFFSATMEYEYEIEAQSGRIYSRSIEPLDAHERGTNQSGSSGSTNSGSSKGNSGSSSGSTNSGSSKGNSGSGSSGGTSGGSQGSTGNNGSSGGTNGGTSGGWTNPNPNYGGDYITVDQAKSIAVKHAGFSVSEVNFEKAKLDHDDGYTVYEIEFYKNGIEYDYTINALNGTILDFDRDY